MHMPCHADSLRVATYSEYRMRWVCLNVRAMNREDPFLRRSKKMGMFRVSYQKAARTWISDEKLYVRHGPTDTIPHPVLSHCVHQMYICICSCALHAHSYGYILFEYVIRQYLSHIDVKEHTSVLWMRVCMCVCVLNGSADWKKSWISQWRWRNIWRDSDVALSWPPDKMHENIKCFPANSMQHFSLSFSSFLFLFLYISFLVYIWRKEELQNSILISFYYYYTCTVKY